MTPQEINEAVARKMGWHSDSQFGWFTPSTKYRGPNDAICQTKVPDYCRDIKAAWEILGQVDGWEIRGNGQSKVRVSLAGRTNYSNGEADTAPMAICKAFLGIS